MQRYISIDVATKSLALTIAEHNDETINLQNPETLSNLLIIKTITKNLAPNRANNTLSEIERVTLMRNFVNEELLQYATEDTIILLEKQIATTPTYICYITLMSIFIDKDFTVLTIAPTFKNQLVIGDEKIGKYLQKCSNSYKANKQHSLALSRVIVNNVSDNKNVIFDKKMETDFADSLCQLIAFLTLNI